MTHRTDYRRRAATATGLATALTLALTLTQAAALGTAAAAAPQPDVAILGTDAPNAIEGSYIVVLKDSEVSASQVRGKANGLAKEHKGKVKQTWGHALRGFEAELSAEDAAKLAADPAVAYVEQNATVTLDATQSPTPSWGLDRIDQRTATADSSYTYPNNGAGITAYIVDTGILTTHSDFGGRAVHGTDTVDGDSNATDCNGHGTHVAGTVGGSAYGVAKGVTLVGVRVLDCAGSGTNAGVVSGINWVAADHDAGEKAVANMSLGGSANSSINTAVTNAIADGVTFVVAAGNETTDACTKSPASTPNAITVGATQSNDAKASYSNYGTCLDIFAPGSSITSAWHTSTSATNTISGTSMASPHVAGAAALVLNAYPSYTPAQVRDKLVADATPNVVTSPGTGSPNRLLYVGSITPPTQDFSISVSPASGAVNPGSSVTATVSTATTAGAAQSVALSATGLPAGVTATFSPATVTSGGTSTMTLTASSSATAGTTAVTVRGAGGVTTNTTSYALTVNGAPGCSQVAGTDYAINDNSTIESPVTISGCAGTATQAVVDVDITHTYRGDLDVTLVAPDGSLYVLLNNAGGSADNVDQAFTVALSEVANGTWRLRVADTAGGDTGTLTNWSLNLTAGGTTPPPGSCSGANGTDAAISDNTTINSPITIAGCAGTKTSAVVDVDITHTYRGDLVVSLVAPDGTVYTLLNRNGGSADNVDQAFTVTLSNETANGTWNLRVQDAAGGDVGTLTNWSLTL
ncbi:S8 family peptidase [Antribacter gilvus]|uniref:S8 family peptidase n=1 Tax=Antribacter gilvus TaxID=2304675 RepID=UPI001F0CCB9F|nr:S8 family peptidase [Antribacter gilvus]